MYTNTAGSTDPATGKVVRLSRVINELAKVVEDDVANHSFLNDGYEYLLVSAKFGFSQLSTAILRWVVVSASELACASLSTLIGVACSVVVVVPIEEADTTTQRKKAVLN